MARDYAGTRTASGTRGTASGSIVTSSGDAFLLLETGDDILLETGDKIILDGITGEGVTTIYRSVVTSTRTAVV